MQKIILSVLLLAGTGALKAQPPKTQANRTQVPKPVTPVNILKTTNDSVSYVLGEIAAFNLVQQGLGDVKINNTVFLRALNDILGKKQTLMDDVTANALLNNYMVKLQQDKVKPAIEEGNKFLAQNKLKPGVKTTASGLQYEVITEGQGNKPAAIDTFVAHYRGTLLNGTEFDASYNRGQPLTLGVSQVIRGWTEGLQLMPIGSKYKFWIPYDLGYGVMGQGQIPGGALLIFEVELLDVKKKQE
ncbi:MAG: FKBP-type peptidyl-prolyl cis-trans isomerase [Chitinophagaceae bacterium]|jgi:FKBP-type peptidyl-prolyl cis-trans isomerase FklB|nr:FKBP-type peptidyl-prolyl cis-trans isomerase [Chitinophagaceae bacterium]MBK7679067.1 FKBP-type peptidyl-prolyl cis-trans isomerase [Chitinophagaceae bacterium]MBK8299588.1 FKBP-type peptidyl-prolyl cis-trans isomerase [Chitinophagaceae bacterium]MBK9463638.1 FKBP-type peptidyl-prolyl cis-trans isomerase [Chitinophagaceae bacterium]MBK9659241.1 FKBP-type peptidyl-prolyl cis-trans isomerase [Chitinophagaceae bacterium]